MVSSCVLIRPFFFFFRGDGGRAKNKKHNAAFFVFCFFFGGYVHVGPCLDGGGKSVRQLFFPFTSSASPHLILPSLSVPSPRVRQRRRRTASPRPSICPNLSVSTQRHPHPPSSISSSISLSSLICLTEGRRLSPKRTERRGGRESDVQGPGSWRYRLQPSDCVLTRELGRRNSAVKYQWRRVFSAADAKPKYRLSGDLAMSADWKEHWLTAAPNIAKPKGVSRLLMLWSCMNTLRRGRFFTRARWSNSWGSGRRYELIKSH